MWGAIFPPVFAPVLVRLQCFYFYDCLGSTVIDMVLCLAFLLKQAAIENLQNCVFLLQMLSGSWGNCCVSAHNMCQCKVMLFYFFFSLKWYLGCHFLKLVPCMINEHVLFRTLECTWETWAVLLTFSVNLNKCFLSLSLFLPRGLKPNKCHQWLLLAVDLWTCLSICRDTHPTLQLYRSWIPRLLY